MNQPAPASHKFSILLPVRNGGEYIRTCVNSILAQSLPDFNLIILDSGSTDGTIGWLQSLQDSRIQVHLSPVPLTIEANWERIKSVSRNEWMTIIGHDDVLKPDYLRVMADLIDRYPDASLYQAHFDLIGVKGQFLRACKPMAEKESAAAFLKKILDNTINVYGTGFMLRTKDYDAVGGIPPFPNLMSADYALWLKVSCLGYKATSPENCFSYRINQSTTAKTENEVYIKAIKLFVDYLLDAKECLCFETDQKEYIKRILSFYCQRVTRRLVLVNKKQRNNLSVEQFIKECRVYASQLLGNDNDFNPAAVPGVWAARIIDSSELTRSMFLLVKKIHPNPLVQ